MLHCRWSRLEDRNTPGSLAAPFDGTTRWRVAISPRRLSSPTVSPSGDSSMPPRATLTAVDRACSGSAPTESSRPRPYSMLQECPVEHAGTAAARRLHSAACRLSQPGGQACGGMRGPAGTLPPSGRTRPKRQRSGRRPRNRASHRVHGSRPQAEVATGMRNDAAGDDCVAPSHQLTPGPGTKYQLKHHHGGMISIVCEIYVSSGSNICDPLRTLKHCITRAVLSPVGLAVREWLFAVVGVRQRSGRNRRARRQADQVSGPGKARQLAAGFAGSSGGLPGRTD